MFPIISMMKRTRPASLCTAGALRRIMGRNCSGSKIPAALYISCYSKRYFFHPSGPYVLNIARRERKELQTHATHSIGAGALQ